MSEENLEIYRIAKVLQTVKEIWYSFFHTTCESKKNASMLFLMYNLFHITTLSMLIWSATSISNTLMFVAFVNLLPPFSHHFTTWLKTSWSMKKASPGLLDLSVSCMLVFLYWNVANILIWTADAKLTVSFRQYLWII